MTRNDVQNGVNRSWQFLEKLDLAETFSKADPLAVDTEIRDLATDPRTSYAQLYLRCLEKSFYNLLLSDFSFLQFGWNAVDEVRYAFYPNPFFAGEERQKLIRSYRDLVDAGMMESEDFLAIIRGKEEPDPRVPLLRYENSPPQYKGLAHPCSHLHIGHHGENRWPLSRILTPLAFSMWVGKQYFSPRWRIFDNADNDFGNELEEALSAERANCRIIGDNLFDDYEKRSFHLC